MKFITEMELRDLYRREPFTTYSLEPDTKITPGARQFLVDRRVTLVQNQANVDKQQPSDTSNQAQSRESWMILRLLGKIDCLESLFLLIAAELFHFGNAILSEEVIELGKCFQNVKKAERGQITSEKIQFWGWSEEEISDRSAKLEKQVDLSEFQVESENSKEIALLNYLRASLREIEPAILEAYWNEEKQSCSRQDLIDSVNLIINILGMMIWKCLGGKKWTQ
ncbi:ethanolamine utilization cobalamin adenosyltransferase [Desulfosporosinus sp. HMP52]|uniref:ethanolamine utilization cobalamin adenosyltransferase n=1 Tax=Desulfosporosinus sp. HMP52 TaxID=1487923 RepID=UPI00051FB09E|nr:ethanolamine utilization cobalamin adenosyltransferase [Desulfosporosinus sp. HMP52]KGK85067.1 ethanolamine utilization cobalamin adenosyltransferase [Desulfosporosinus sp. HMP52]